MSQRELEDLRRNWISKLLLLAEQWNNRKMNMMKTATNGTTGTGGNNPPPMHGILPTGIHKIT